MADDRTQLADAESQLGRVDARMSVDAFERIAATGHDAAGEMGLVRAYMQLGRYRQALAFAAHGAGEHIDEPGAGVLYAWLLRAGGQGQVAAQVLSDVRTRAPTDGLARDAADAFAEALPLARGALLARPHRLAPVAFAAIGAPVPDGARIVSSGVLFDGGRRAIAVAPENPTHGGHLWVRNGLGETREATIETTMPVDTGSAVVVLRLIEPIDTEGADTPAPRDPFAGSPGFAFELATRAPAAPAWPQLRSGFVGSLAAAPGLRHLGFVMSEPVSGGPVFDAGGRLAGLTVPGPPGQPRWLPVSMWTTLLSASGNAPSAAASPAGILPLDQVYERGLRIAVQVIAPE